MDDSFSALGANLSVLGNILLPLHSQPRNSPVSSDCIIDNHELRYYNIDPPGLLESTDAHTHHCSYDLSILIEEP